MTKGERERDGDKGAAPNPQEFSSSEDETAPLSQCEATQAVKGTLGNFLSESHTNILRVST